MTGLLSPPRRVTDFYARRSPLRGVVIAGVAAALQAAAFSLLGVTVVVLSAWATAAHSAAGLSEAVAACLYTWLLAVHTHFVTPDGTLGLAPLGLTGLGAWLLFARTQRAARAHAVTGLVDVAALTCATAATYGLIAVVLAAGAPTQVVRPVVVTAFLGASLTAGLAGGAGAARGAQAWPSLWRRLPGRIRLCITAGGAASAVLLAGGLLAVGVAFCVRATETIELAQALNAGVTGGLLIALLSLAYLPNAAAWATSFLLGPGFSVGTGTSVSLGGVELGAVPAFPLLAALPPDGKPPVYAYAFLLVPVAAGVVVALVLRRGAARGTAQLMTWRQAVTLAAGSGAVTGIVVSAGTLVADGPGGPGRLADVGPTWWAAGPVAALWITSIALLTLILRRGRPAA